MGVENSPLLHSLGLIGVKLKRPTWYISEVRPWSRNKHCPREPLTSIGSFGYCGFVCVYVGAFIMSRILKVAMSRFIIFRQEHTDIWIYGPAARVVRIAIGKTEPLFLWRRNTSGSLDSLAKFPRVSTSGGTKTCLVLNGKKKYDICHDLAHCLSFVFPWSTWSVTCYHGLWSQHDLSS